MKEDNKNTNQRFTLPQQRSLKMSWRSDWSVFELTVATSILIALNAATWLFMRASNGDTTMVIPWSITAGS